MVPDGANLVAAAWESIQTGQVAGVPKDCLWLLILLAARNLLLSNGRWTSCRTPKIPSRKHDDFQKDPIPNRHGIGPVVTFSFQR